MMQTSNALICRRQNRRAAPRLILFVGARTPQENSASTDNAYFPEGDIGSGQNVRIFPKGTSFSEEDKLFWVLPCCGKLTTDRRPVLELPNFVVGAQNSPLGLAHLRLFRLSEVARA
jgi:hypothetical protein